MSLATARTHLPELRVMTESDVPAVLEIERAGHSHPWSEGLFRDCLKQPYWNWVLEVEGEVAGFIIVMVAVGEAHILDVCMAPAFRRKGWGRRMIEAVMQAARDHADVLFLEVRPSNLPAISLYESMGFNELGRRPKYYPAKDGREDALIMARALLGGFSD